jgi:hypothetical protein
MLQQEEDALTREYGGKVQTDKEKRLEEMKLKAEEVRRKREAELQKLVQEKRLQLYS